MELKVENNFQLKYMQQAFAVPVSIATPGDVQTWRSQWMSALKMWHSPYKALIDCTNLSLASPSAPDTQKALLTMLKFFEGLFLRQAAGFGLDPSKGHDLLPFPVYASIEEALGALAIRTVKEKGAPVDFRDAIQIQNHFQQHVVELGFSMPVVIDDQAKIDALKSKLTNNLMQWHSKWSLLIDCTNLDFSDGISPSFALLERYLRGFYMKVMIGYSPRSAKESYPFEVFRARHNAAARLGSEGNFSGDAADCNSRKS